MIENVPEAAALEDEIAKVSGKIGFIQYLYDNPTADNHAIDREYFNKDIDWISSFQVKNLIKKFHRLGSHLDERFLDSKQGLLLDMRMILTSAGPDESELVLLQEIDEFVRSVEICFEHRDKLLEIARKD